VPWDPQSLKFCLNWSEFSEVDLGDPVGVGPHRQRAVPVHGQGHLVVGELGGQPPGGQPGQAAFAPQLWHEPRMLRQSRGWPPLTSVAVPVTLPSRVMVSSASACPSTYRSKKASVTRARRRSTRFVPSYGLRWLAPNRSR